MAQRNSRRAIKDALADIPEPKFKEFCLELRSRRGERRVPLSQVEGKTRIEIVEVLISTFTEAEAVAVTAELLQEIRCNEQATILLEETRGQSSRNSGAAAVNPTARSGSTEADFVDKHRAALIDKVTDVVAILDDLLDNEVITEDIYNKIRLMPLKKDQMRELYLGPLKAAGRAGKEVFYKSLQKNDKYLMNGLLEKE